MPHDISTIERHLLSKDKQLRLKALKLLLQHPDATPIQLVRGLCSEDNRDFEFLKVFELGSAMRATWTRLRGVTNDEVYEYLSSSYAANPTRNVNHIVHILELLCTQRALGMLEALRATAPPAASLLVERAAKRVSQQLVNSKNLE